MRGGREAERLLEGLDAPADLVRQDAADLRERAVGVESVTAGGQEAQRDGGGLGRGQHQRRHAVAGPQAIAAGGAALGLDGDAQILE